MPWPEIAGDARFFAQGGPQDIAAIRVAIGLPAEPSSAARQILGVAPLQTAGPEQISFLDNRRYVAALEASQAGAVIVHPQMRAHVPPGAIALVTEEPYLAWARVAGLFHPPPPTRPGIHRTAVIEPDAWVDPTAEIGPFVQIGQGAQIGRNCRIAAGAVIGQGVVLGEDGRIGPHASLSHVLAGARVTVHAGARIGQEGFGFAISAAGFRSVPQLGRVILEDDVDIGANTTIDRGSAHDTVIGAGTRLDNLVQIGHNVRLGRACVVVAQAGISGSTVVEDQAMLGGQAGLIGHLHIGRGARIGGQAGVMADVPAGADVVGSPAQPVREFFRHVAMLRRLVRQAESDRRGGRAERADMSGTD